VYLLVLAEMGAGSWDVGEGRCEGICAMRGEMRGVWGGAEISCRLLFRGIFRREDRAAQWARRAISSVAGVWNKWFKWSIRNSTRLYIV